MFLYSTVNLFRAATDVADAAAADVVVVVIAAAAAVQPSKP